MKIDKIYILTDAPIPIGFAPTNRILSYISGFRQNRMECEILVFRKTENPANVRNVDPIGQIDGTKYRYLYKTTFKSKYFIKRRIDNFFGLLRLIIFACRSIDNKSAIIYYSSYTRYVVFLKIIKYFKGFLLLKEESEHPLIRKKSKNKISWYFFKKYHYRFFDGYLLMTLNLVRYFQEKYPHKPYVQVPMTVDLKRFNSQKVKKENYITYTGSLKNKKDGVLFLLKAFNEIKKEFKNYKLLICGFSNSKKELEEFENYIKVMSLQSNVFLYKDVKNTDIPEILQKSRMLVLPRPMSLQAENGFPTKLGEYLASETPTLVTKVGAIPKYLKDGESSFIAIPNDVESLKEKMKEILLNPEKAKIVALKGRKVAEKYFNNIKQTKEIIDFINTSF